MKASTGMSCVFGAFLLFPLLTSTTASTAGPIGAGGAGTPRILRYNVSEELPADTYVGDVRADYSRTASGDAILLSPSTKFALRGSSPYFRMENASTGVLRTARQLDRETICPNRPLTCELTIDITVRAVQLFAVVKVIVNIEDINDHSPEFPPGSPRIHIVIPADTAMGTLFSLPAADDQDSGPLGTVQYRIDVSTTGNGVFPRMIFELKVTDLVDGSQDVRLKLVGRMDQRPTPLYSLSIVATDGGSPPRSSSLPVSIAVERPPQAVVPRFEQSVYTGRVAENQPRRHPVVQVRAHLYSPDANFRPSSTSSQQITYSLEPAEVGATTSTSTFGIESLTGLVYVRDDVDYERERTHRLTVVATYSGGTGSRGGGTGQRSNAAATAAASLVIDVIDVNDNAPVITVNALTRSNRAELPESAADDTFVAHLSVHDADGAGDNSRTTCALVNAVEAGGHSTHRQSSTGATVTDDFRLYQMVSGAQPEYKLVTSGDGRFDRETIDSYLVIISCTDYGSPAMTTTATIPVDITDENDNDPTFNSQLYLIEYNLGSPPPVNTTLIMIDATDRDVGPNAALRYSLSSDDPAHSGLLSVNPVTGAVSTLSSSGFEPDNDYRYVATVTDCGVPPRTSTAEVLVRTVNVVVTPDVSNRPNHFQIECDQAVFGQLVGRVQVGSRRPSASYNDPIDDQLSFVLSQPNTMFQVDSSNGDIYLASGLDVEPILPEVIELSVQVVHGDTSPPIVESVGVSVEIRCPLPRFLFPNPLNDTVKVSTLPKSTHTTANSADENHVTKDTIFVYRSVVQTRPGYRVRYALVNGNNDGLFTIDSTSGIITTSDTASFSRRRQRFRLSISAVASENEKSEIEVLADLRVVVSTVVTGSIQKFEGDDDDGEDIFSASMTNVDKTTTSGLLLLSDSKVIFIGIACGAGGLVLVVLIIVVLSVTCKQRNRRRCGGKHIHNYNCRIEAANKCRQQGNNNGFPVDDPAECSSLRHADECIASNDVINRTGPDGNHSHPKTNLKSGDRTRSGKATSLRLDDDDGGQTSAVDGGQFETPWTSMSGTIHQQNHLTPQTSGSATSTLKSSTKKEVKFCLDVVSDEVSSKRPLNVAYHKPTTSPSPVVEAVIFQTGCGASSRLPLLPTPLRSILATDDDDDDEGGSVGSGGSVTDSGRGASEEGDSSGASRPVSLANGYEPAAAAAAVTSSRQDTPSQRSSQHFPPQPAYSPVATVAASEYYPSLYRTSTPTLSSSTNVLTDDYHPTRFPSPSSADSGNARCRLIPSLSTFRSDTAPLPPQCALSLATDVPIAATAAAVAAAAAAGCVSWISQPGSGTGNGDVGARNRASFTSEALYRPLVTTASSPPGIPVIAAPSVGGGHNRGTNGHVPGAMIGSTTERIAEV